MDPLLLSLFENTKLTDKQTKVYMALLQLGQATISQISELSKLKRTNIYGVIFELESLGYVHEVVGKKVQTYAATDPNRVVGELKRGIKSLEEMLPYLRAVQRRSSKPYVQYYSGIEGAREAFTQIYRPKEARYLGSISRAKEAIPEEVKRWQKIYLSGKARPGGKHLLTDSTSDRGYASALTKSGQFFRYLKPGVSLDVDIALVEDTIFLTTFEDIIHTAVIKSPALYRALCLLYDLAWDNSVKQAD